MKLNKILWTFSILGILMLSSCGDVQIPGPEPCLTLEFKMELEEVFFCDDIKTKDASYRNDEGKLLVFKVNTYDLFYYLYICSYEAIHPLLTSEPSLNEEITKALSSDVIIDKSYTIDGNYEYNSELEKAIGHLYACFNVSNEEYEEFRTYVTDQDIDPLGIVLELLLNNNPYVGLTQTYNTFGVIPGDINFYDTYTYKI